MLGTTQLVNALVTRRGLARVMVVRLCGPATRALPPLSGFPPGLRAAHFFAEGEPTRPALWPPARPRRPHSARPATDARLHAARGFRGFGPCMQRAGLACSTRAPLLRSAALLLGGRKEIVRAPRRRIL